MAAADVGNEVGFGVRLRQVLELCINGGAGATIDSLTQLMSEAEATFDSDATAKYAQPTVLNFLKQLIANRNQEMAAVDDLIHYNLQNRAAADFDAVSLPTDIHGLAGEMARYMRDNTLNVLETTPSISSVTAGGTNTGNGTVIVDMLSTWNENNQNIPDGCDYWAVCEADAITGGMNEHQELFSISSSFAGKYDGIYVCHYPAADGTGNTGGGNRLQNEDGTTPGSGGNSDYTISWENFTSDTPDGWTVDVGSAGTQVNEESTEYYFGSKCLEFLGDAGSTLTAISQSAYDFFGATAGGSTVVEEALSPLAHYLIGVYCKSHASMAAGVFEFKMTGTGYTAGSTEKATYDFTSGALTSWTFKHGIVQMPRSIPSDVAVSLALTTALTNTREAWFDGAVFAKMHYIPAFGQNVAIIAGSTAFVYHHEDSERFIWTSSNDWAGLFQEWFARTTDQRDPNAVRYANLQVALPSDPTASSEFAESKAQ